jgi:hypothetical protein
MYDTISLAHNLSCTYDYHVKNKHGNLPGEVNLCLHYDVSYSYKMYFFECFTDVITVTMQSVGFP